MGSTGNCPVSWKSSHGQCTVHAHETEAQALLSLSTFINERVHVYSLHFHIVSYTASITLHPTTMVCCCTHVSWRHQSSLWSTCTVVAFGQNLQMVCGAHSAPGNDERAGFYCQAHSLVNHKQNEKRNCNHIAFFIISAHLNQHNILKCLISSRKTGGHPLE